MKNIFFAVIVALSYFCSSISHAADPCSDDPFCIKAENTRFDNPNHYVFVAAYPGDELLIYPFMKDHCSDESSYCAMIIATQGKSGCESESDSSCGKSRTLELERSSKYLNVDVWHYDLPDSNGITPNTLEQTRLTYQRIAQDAGLNHVSSYFQSMFNKLQLNSNKPLVVASLHPYRGAISYADDHVMRVLDESIEQAVEALQKTGRVVSHLYVNSEMSKEHSEAVKKDDNSSLLCRNGGEQLRATNTDLTNFEVFKHGFYDIYPSQAFHTGDIANEPDRYEFCLGNAKKYFSTSRNEKLFGFALMESSQISEVSSFSNAFAFYPSDLADIADYLNKNSRKLVPFIEVGRFLFDESTGLFGDLDINPMIRAIKNSTYQGPILFIIDEPLWRIRLACFSQNLAACSEVDNQYANTIDLFRKVGKELRKALPETGLVHIEAFAELILQKRKAPLANVIMLDSAEYLGYDCYGSFDNCGMPDVSQTFSNTDIASFRNFNIVTSFSQAYPQTLTSYKITDQDIIKFFTDELLNFPLTKFINNLNPLFNTDLELTLVCNSSNAECIVNNTNVSGDIPSMPQSVYIDWIKNAVLSMENSNPIGRKILLVPGAFQDFHIFPYEDLAIDQINAFTQVLDSSDLFGGMGAFIWGDMQDGIKPIIGARSLFNVKYAIAQIFRERMLMQKSDTSLKLDPAMSLAGAIGTRGSFQQVSANNATDGGIYFQSADMDACSLKIANQTQQPLALNKLNHVAIPIAETPLQIEAVCSKQQQVFTRTVRFIK